MRPADSTLEAPLAGVDDAAAAPPVVRDPVPAAELAPEAAAEVADLAAEAADEATDEALAATPAAVLAAAEVADSAPEAAEEEPAGAAAAPEDDKQASDEPGLMVKASLYLGTPVESTRANPTEVPAEMLTFQVMGLLST